MFRFRTFFPIVAILAGIAGVEILVQRHVFPIRHLPATPPSAQQPFPTHTQPGALRINCSGCKSLTDARIRRRRDGSHRRPYILTRRTDVTRPMGTRGPRTEAQEEYRCVP